MSLTPAFDPGPVHDQLDALLPGTDPVMLGYSGGGDSHALLLIASHWAKKKNRSLHAVIVDHGLRDGSAVEAERARGAADTLGVMAHIRTCSRALKPDTGIQVKARAMRYQAFAEMSGALKSDQVLLAHTADDQAETIWMRLLAGAGYRGLAAMSMDDPFPAPNSPMRILRPLLGAKRTGLRNWLASQGANWIDDPSNQDRLHTRVRMRQMLATLEVAGLSISQITALSGQCRDLSADVSAQAGQLFLDTVALEIWGGVRLDHVKVLRAPKLVQRRLMEAAIAVATGQGPPFKRSGVDALLSGLTQKQAATGAGAALIWNRSQPRLVRDPGMVLGRDTIDALDDQPVAELAGGTWDGRFQIRVTDTANLRITSLNAVASENSDALLAVPELARKTLPCVHAGGTILAIPGVITHPGVTFVHNGAALARRCLFAGQAPAWFDASLQESAGFGSQMRG